MKRIVMIDDEPLVTKGLSRFLGRHGFEVVVFSDPVAGEQYLHQEPWDVLVLDLAMPGRTGHEILAALSDEQAKRVVVLSSTTTPSTIAQLQARVAAYVKKPTTGSALLGVIQTLGPVQK
ncbi:MAG: response regulator [Chloroflexi bacterium]|nr:response regulator [Chloroflexota bacterium]MBU1750202.1 response regulator [Chloroflexota bacterium]